MEEGNGGEDREDLGVGERRWEEKEEEMKSEEGAGTGGRRRTETLGKFQEEPTVNTFISRKRKVG